MNLDFMSKIYVLLIQFHKMLTGIVFPIHVDFFKLGNPMRCCPDE